jgi:hypothetical protein
LKEIISQNSPVTAQRTPSTQILGHSTDDIVEQKRKEFKKIFTETLQTKQPDPTRLEIDPSKRKSLKNFLDRQPSGGLVS